MEEQESEMMYTIEFLNTVLISCKIRRNRRYRGRNVHSLHTQTELG